MAEKAREEGERESAVNFWSPWLAEVFCWGICERKLVEREKSFGQEIQREDKKQIEWMRSSYFIIEREKKLNKIMPKNYSTFVCTEPFLEHHCTPS